MASRPHVAPDCPFANAMTTDQTTLSKTPPHPKRPPLPRPSSRARQPAAALAEMSDAYLRAKAEVENTRRRRAEGRSRKGPQVRRRGLCRGHAAGGGQPDRRHRHARRKVETVLEGVRHAAPADPGPGAQQGCRDQPGLAPSSTPIGTRPSRSCRPSKKQHRRGGAPEGLSDRRPRAAPGPGHRQRTK